MRLKDVATPVDQLSLARAVLYNASRISYNSRTTMRSTKEWKDRYSHRKYRQYRKLSIYRQYYEDENLPLHEAVEEFIEFKDLYLKNGSKGLSRAIRDHDLSGRRYDLNSSYVCDTTYLRSDIIICDPYDFGKLSQIRGFFNPRIIYR